MTIEIRELVIEARVTPTQARSRTYPNRGAEYAVSVPNMSRVEQERLIETISRRVLENLCETQNMQGDWS